ncbi:MAG: tetratricopeptide repeat protein [Chloroflexi bacterium]|nr:tetratricopeptide repeat protein [Chloroflexota bacterium]
MDETASRNHPVLSRRVLSAVLSLPKGLPEPLADASLKVLAVATALLILGFGGYYFFNRYYHQEAAVQNLEIRRLEADVIKDPQSAEPRVRVAWAYLDQGMVDQAVVQFGEALKLRENYQAALIGLGTAFFRKNDYANALVSLEQVAELNRNNPFKRTLRELQAVYYYLGSIYAQQGKDQEAISSFREALDIDRADADSLYGLGQVYLRQGQLNEAAPLLEQAVRFDPVFSDGYRALAAVYEQQGKVGHLLWVKAMMSFTQNKYDESLGYLNQAIRVLPDLPEAHQAQGLVYEKMGRSADALAAFQTALEKDPRLPLAQAGVARLKR